MPAPLLALTLLGATWTVDDDQPADFPQIQAAVSSPLVTDGDVLRVGFGLYDPFHLTKRLTILGPAAVADAVVTGTTRLDAAGGFDVSRLRFASLEVTNVPARGRLTDCRVGVDLSPVGTTALRVVGYHQLLIDGTDVQGRPADSAQERPTGASIDGSNVVVTGGTIFGGAGESCFGSWCLGGDGGAGLEVLGGSDVLLVDSVVQGGAAGAGSCGLSQPCTNDGRAGDGLVVDLSTVRLRSSGAATGAYLPMYGGTPGSAVNANAAVLTANAGAFTGPLDLTATTLVVPPAPEPTLALAGASVVGSVLGLIVANAPPAAPLLLLASASPGLVEVPRYEGALWIDPAAPFVLVAAQAGAGGTLDVVLPIPPDPSLVGLAVDLQAAFPTVPGTLDPNDAFLANPVPVVLNGL